MGLMILGVVAEDRGTQYRGTYRDSPLYRDDLAEDHPINRTILRMMSESEDAVQMQNIEFALDCVRVLNQYEGYDRFEVIEMVESDQQPLYDGIFIGYDLSNGHLSLLDWGLQFRRLGVVSNEDKVLSMIQPLGNLIQAYFQPRLNTNGLFEYFDEASFCLDCLMALQAIRPGLFENEEVVFKVLKLWRVPIPSQ